MHADLCLSNLFARHFVVSKHLHPLDSHMTTALIGLFSLGMNLSEGGENASPSCLLRGDDFVVNEWSVGADFDAAGILAS